MKLLLADSGSTTTEWCLLQDKTPSQTISSTGINPYYLDDDAILSEIRTSVLPVFADVDAIRFYGAGCHSRETASRIRSALTTAYGDIPIEVKSDLFGAARALFHRQGGIACILGTGSNSCHYDGERIMDQIPPLGFILGDEGSAGCFGRKILQGYFYREMPEELREWLEAHHEMSRETVLNAVYHGSRPNQYVAGFSKMFDAWPGHPWLADLLQTGISEFLDRHVRRYDAGPEVAAGFVGSLAYAHKELIIQELQERNIPPGPFLRSPMEGLRKYHLDHQSEF
ncbi:hypothetical protein QA596_07115 [Balneolales bacterium ANBcel1]|nr:hypothetical protein [Balneolales bacterium ANBcel1]